MRTRQTRYPDTSIREANVIFEGFHGSQWSRDTANGNVSFTSKQDVLLRERRALSQRRHVFPFIEPRR